MSLAPGARVGPYEVTAALGAGGMGEVYRARDASLGRDVALKILSDLFTSDPERIARFEREARTLAALNHPNIAQIYGLERSTGTAALVMELVDGPTLADRIAQGPLPVADALSIARQIAEALEAAHELGIVHRDLKPANVKVRHDDVVKVLDFGLAKIAEPERAPGELANSPTITSPALTERGMILGTAAYMAPEQARGRPVDRRADIWAFGVVLYEMLTGRRAFAGADVTDVLAAVLRDTPSLDALPPDTPASIRRLLRRCLQKDRKERLADAGAARLEINDAMTGAEVGPAIRVSNIRWPLVAAGAVGLVALAGSAAWFLKPDPPVRPIPVVWSQAALPGGLTWSRPGRHVIAISPDGTKVAYVAGQQLYVRALNELDGRPLPGIKDPSEPFFSPDSAWVGFWAQGQLQKVALSGGAPVPLTPTTNPFGASWEGDTIVFGLDGDLMRVPASGGPAERLVERANNERLVHPTVLPGGRVVLFSRAVTGAGVASVNWDDAEIMAENLGSRERRVLIRGGTDARYLPSGHLVYGHRGELLAVTLDPVTLDVGGPPVSLVSDVGTGQGSTGMMQYAVSPTGTLVVAPGSAQSTSHLVWVDLNGQQQPVIPEAGTFNGPRLSRDGHRLAFSDFSGGNADVFVLDLARGAKSQFTTDPTNDGTALWTPDGTRLVFSSARDAGITNLYWQAADGTGAVERLTTSTRLQQAWSWTSDGSTLLYTEANPTSGQDIYAMAVNGDRAPRALLTAASNETRPALSPDDQWMAYQSDELGAVEIVVRPYPDLGRSRHQVSVGGGMSPVWAPDGRTLYYRQGARIYRVGVSTTPTFTSGAPEVAVDLSGPGGLPANPPVNAPPFALAPDGKRFIVVRPAAEGVTTYQVVVNWAEDLAARVKRAP